MVFGENYKVEWYPKADIINEYSPITRITTRSISTATKRDLREAQDISIKASEYDRRSFAKKLQDLHKSQGLDKESRALYLFTLDQRMVAANTIYRFIESQKSDRYKKILKDLFTNDEVVNMMLATDRDSEVEIPMELKGINWDLLNNKLYELSLRIHCETGSPMQIYFIDYESNKDGKLTFSKFNNGQHHEVEDEDYFDYAPKKRNLISVSGNAIDKFKDVIETGKLYYSLYSRKKTNIALLAHNRKQLPKLLAEYLNNLIRYGHAKPGAKASARNNFIVFDDSNDKQRDARLKQVKTVWADRFKKAGINLVVMDEEAKKMKIGNLADKMIKDEDCPYTAEGIGFALDFILGTKSGVGGQRNWSMLYKAIAIDDDVHPYTQFLTDPKSLRYFPVDFVSTLNRVTTRPDTVIANYTYCGKYGSALGPFIYDYFQSKQSKEFYTQEPYGIYTQDTKQENEYWSFSNSLKDHDSGGIVAYSSLPGLEDFTVPAPANAVEYLRMDDLTATDILKTIYAMKTKKGQDGEVESYQPGAAVYHDDFDGPKDFYNLCKKAINEELGLTLFSYLVKKPVLDYYYALSGGIDSNFDSKKALNRLMEYGFELSEALQPENLEQIMKDWRADKTDIGFDAFKERMRNVFIQIAEMERVVKSSPENEKQTKVFKKRKEILDAYLEVLDEYEIRDFYEKNKDGDFHTGVQWKGKNGLNLEEIQSLVGYEALMYAYTIELWPSIVRAAKQDPDMNPEL